MNWVKFTMIDMRLMKSQKAFIVAFPLLASLISIWSDEITFTISYLCFGVLIVSTMPFLMEKQNLYSFIQLLPGSEKDRVTGRYLYFLILLLAFVVLGVGISGILVLCGDTVFQSQDIYFGAALVIISMIVGTLQFAVFYVVGRAKSEQWLNIMRVIPGFAFFFCANYVIDIIEEHPERIQEAIDFINRNKTMLLVAGVVISLVVLMICIRISTAIVKRRDI